jgi:DNA-binding CsgD family transcriptional regulator/tetratricopeptide (TPR) repeat protein
MGRAAGRFVGRDALMATLAEHVQRARDGTRSTVLVAGDAGIGKTRLLTEALSRLRDPKDLVALGHGVELAGGDLPYGTVSDCLRYLVGDAGVDLVRTAAGSGCDSLAAICPALGAAGDDVDRTELLPAFVSTLEALASHRLVWLVVEDLHWSDASSRDLLLYLLRVARPCQLVTVLTVRSHDPAVDPGVERLVDGLAALPDAELVTVTPLDRAAVTELVADLTDGAATHEQVTRIADLGQGSPLLTEELVASGIDASGAVPDAVLKSTLTRLERLQSDTRRLLQTASLADGHLQHRMLSEVYDGGDGDPGRFEGAVAQALDTRILRFDALTRSYSFAHALLREATESSLRPDARILTHRRWAEILSVPENHGNDPWLQIAAAHHWAQTDDAVEAFDATVTAAGIARTLRATAELAPLLRRLLALWDRVPDPEDRVGQTREAVLMDATLAFGNIGNHRESRRLLLDEMKRPATAQWHPVQVLNLRIEYEILGGYLGETGYRDAIAELLDHIPEVLEAPAWPSTIQLLWYAGHRYSATDPHRALRLTERAVELSRELGSEGHYQGSVGNLVVHLCDRARFEEALDLCRAEEQHTDDGERRLGLRTHRPWALYPLGRFQEALSLMEAELARCDPALDPNAYLSVVTVVNNSLVALGSWDRATELLEQVDPSGIDTLDTVTNWLLNLALLSLDQGKTDRAATLADRARALLPDLPHPSAPENPWHTIAADRLFLWSYLAQWELDAGLAAARGDLGRARAHLDDMLAIGPEQMVIHFWPVVTLAARLEGDRGVTDREKAPRPSYSDVSADARSASVDFVDDLVDKLPRQGPFLDARHAQAKADLARARGEDSPQLWRDVADRWRRIEHRHFLGWALLRLATSLVEAGARGDAVDPLSEAGGIADQLGAVPLRDAVIELGARSRLATGLERAEPSLVSERLARLTPREVEVLRHLGVGMSNDELAATLFISPRTASVHVSRIMAKLEVNTRAKAAAIAYEEGLIHTSSG